MKRRKRTVASLALALTLLVVAVGAPLMSQSAEAATLNQAYLFLDDMTVSRGSGMEFILALNPNQSGFTASTITVEFPIADQDLWCNDAGGTSLTATGVAAAAPDDGSTNDIDAALPGTLTASCVGGDGSTVGDKVTITGQTTLTAGTVYGVKVVGNLATLGTATATGSHLVTVKITQGAQVDSKTIGVPLVADGTVAVTATVSAAPSVTCSLSSTTVALGILYQGGAYAVGTHTISAQTYDSAGGYYWAAYGTGDNTTDAGLYSPNSTYLIPSTGSATVNLNSAQGFGMTASAASGATVSADFSDGTPGVFGALDRLYTGAQMVTYQASAQEGSADVSTITYGARAIAATADTDYAETVTFVCGGYY